MNDDGDTLRPSTTLSLWFAAASILLFHGFNAYVYYVDRKPGSRRHAA